MIEGNHYGSKACVDPGMRSHRYGECVVHADRATAADNKR